VVKKISETLIQELTARLSESPKEYVNSVGVVLKLFFPSHLVMGAPRGEPGQRANEFQRKVILKKPFYAGKHEITNAQYAKFNKSRDSKNAPNLPVSNVSWVEAASFCNWLSQKDGLETVYLIKNGKFKGFNGVADGYRLLSEAEWEWLARKASRAKQTIFTWGDKPVVPPLAGNIADESVNGKASFYVPNYSDGYVDLAPVGSFNAEKSGLFDLTGNVSEWVHDSYSLMPPDKTAKEVDPLGPPDGDNHVFKGSNFRSGTRTELRAAFREGGANGRDDLGFRIGRYLYGGSHVEH
jgi:formylglycine-generating enzyme required for sulfatase activity